jgi:hypothetical protein
MRMKKLAADLKAVKREINALTKKLGQLSKKADKLIQSQTVSKAKPKAKAKVKPKAKPKTKAKAAKKPVKKTPAAKKVTPTDQVLKIMKRYKKGVNIARIKELSGFKDKQISNIVHRASKKGKLERVARGVYKLV